MKSIRYAPKSSQAFLMKQIKAKKGTAYIKKGTFTTELIWGKFSYVFTELDEKQKKAFNKGMFLFGMVRKDVKEYLQKHPEIKLPKKYNQIEYSGNIDERLFGKVTGTDLNHAYWRIAYLKGIISELTYLKGLPDEFKSVRLAALSTMGQQKKYQIIKDGMLTHEYKIIKGNEQLQNVYKLIRYTCYRYMNQVRKMLGKDFLCYKTDCIYYIDTKQNRKKVNDFFMKKDLLIKQLE